jgi:uncharacterized protein GlcG (DUF336 family)
MPLNLAAAQKIVSEALAHAHKSKFQPLSVVVLDARAVVIAVATEDGTSLKRFEIARGKANATLTLNMGGRKLGDMAAERPHFFAGLAHVAGDGGVVPVAGGVLVKDQAGAVLGAVGVSGDVSDKDEAAAIAGITAAGFVADGG